MEWSAYQDTDPKHRLRFHLVFVPKYRKRVLDGKVAVRLEQLLRQACEVNRWNLASVLSNLEELAIQPDHVHLLVQIPPQFSVSQVMRILKGGTSRVLRAEFPELAEFLYAPEGITAYAGRSLWAGKLTIGFDEFFCLDRRIPLDRSRVFSNHESREVPPNARKVSLRWREVSRGWREL